MPNKPGKSAVMNMYVLGVPIFPFSTIIRLSYGTSEMWHFLFFCFYYIIHVISINNTVKTITNWHCVFDLYVFQFSLHFSVFWIFLNMSVYVIRQLFTI